MVPILMISTLHGFKIVCRSFKTRMKDVAFNMSEKRNTGKKSFIKYTHINRPEKRNTSK